MNIFNIFNRNEKDNNKQVTLEEKWSIDSESYNNLNYKHLTGETQCYNCVYMNKINIIVSQLHSLFSDSVHKQLELKLAMALT